MAAVDSPETDRPTAGRSARPDGVLLSRLKGFLAGTGGLGRSLATDIVDGGRCAVGAAGGGPVLMVKPGDLPPGDLRSSLDGGLLSVGVDGGLGEVLGDDFGVLLGDPRGD